MVVFAVRNVASINLHFSLTGFYNRASTQFSICRKVGLDRVLDSQPVEPIMGKKFLIFSSYDRLQDVRGNLFNGHPGIQTSGKV